MRSTLQLTPFFTGLNLINLGMDEQSTVTAKSQQRTNPGFSVKLEALRGLAALMVVGHHTFPNHTWTHIPFNGSAAVSLFFVLSGYVLGLSLRRGTGTVLQQYGLFLWRRVFRIYPAYFATTLACWIYWQWYPFEGGGGRHLWFFETLQLGHLQQIKNFLFLDQSINPVTWSLKVEMAGSIVLPCLHFLSRKMRWPGWIMLFAAMVLLSFVPGSGASRQRLYMFYLGYLIVDIERLPKFADHVYAMITCLSGCLFLAANFVGDSVGLRFELFVEAISAAGIVLGIQAGGGSLGGILNRPWTRFAGRVSYSVFLCHQLILDVVVSLFHRFAFANHPSTGLAYLYLWLGLLVSLPFVLLVAAALYRWVEAPFMKLGKRLEPAARGLPIQRL
jgi:peptidoglycan/LPS O-acetylase OafA/YrhL